MKSYNNQMKTSKQWELLAPKEWKLKILDPDGWDRKNFQYSFNEELITKQEFMNRLMTSTVSCDLTALNFTKWVL